MNKVKSIILVGPPGAGKGTVSSILKKELKLPYLSTGEIFRSEGKKGTEIGILAKSLIDNGKFVPDEITSEVVKSALSDMKNGYILDGFPRNMNQVHIFEKMIENPEMNIDLVLHLEISDDVILERLTHRQICPTCQATYHKINLPPKTADKCDSCNVPLGIREDDKPELMKQRLQTYHKTTEPVVGYYRTKGILRTVNTDCSVDEMMLRVRAVLKQ